MSRWTRFASIGLTLAALVLAAPRAHAGGSAEEFIQTRQAQVTALLHQGQSAQRDKQVATVLDGMIAYDELAKRSLATHWDDLSDAQHKEFADILKRLVQRSYEKNLKNILEYRVEYLGEEPGSKTRAPSAENSRQTGTNRIIRSGWSVRANGIARPDLLRSAHRARDRAAEYRFDWRSRREGSASSSTRRCRSGSWTSKSCSFRSSASPSPSLCREALRSFAIAAARSSMFRVARR